MNTQTTNFEGALGWDSQIAQESSFILLEPGTYEFVVEKFERGTYQPSPNSKIREVSPKAELTLKVMGGEQGNANVFENLILHTTMEWKVSEFFISIGQKQPGVPFVPNWSTLIGSRGMAEIEVNKYTNQQGQSRENNRVVRFLAPTQAQTQPTVTPQTNTTTNTNPGFSF